MLFVHGNQGGALLGAREFVDSGTLLRFSSGLNITAAAVSQPGFGASDGPADFCGPNTQQAIMAALCFLKKQPSIDPEQIVLYGNSRGAVASAMVAAQVSDLRQSFCPAAFMISERRSKATLVVSDRQLKARLGYLPKPFWLALPCFMLIKSDQRYCSCTAGTTNVPLSRKLRHSPKPCPAPELQSLSACSNVGIEFRAMTRWEFSAHS
jgi:pimeloyl-ACP methyl ester carboxylesterase